MPIPKGWRHSPESKEKIRQALMGNRNCVGRKLSNATKKKIRKGNIGKHISEQTKIKISKNHANFKGQNHPQWKGGFYNHRGYIYIWSPNHPFKNAIGYVKRANLVMEKHLGRYLIPPELVHHKGKKDDDRIENLKLFPNNSKHMKFHYSPK